MTKTSNNRAVTLGGINEIFSAIGIEIEKHEMGYYYATLNGKQLQGKTIVAVSQKILTTIKS
ncbi:MAG: hypothetical protein WBF90_37675 [Rivularia sp. (in: cyanobacteria)]